MKFPQTYTLQQIATIIDADFVGSPEFPVLGMNEIHVVEEGDIVFVDHPKYYDKALQSKATIVLINKRVVCPQGKALLISDDPFQILIYRNLRDASYNRKHQRLIPYRHEWLHYHQ